MASEISINLGLALRKVIQTQALIYSLPSHTLVRDMAGARRYAATQTIGTTKEVLTFGDLATAGYAWFKNLDPTNYIDLGILDGSTFEPLVKLLAGDEALFPLKTLSVYAQANTSPCELDYAILER